MGRDKVNWSIDKDRKAVSYFLRENNFDTTSNILKASHIFCVWYDLLLAPKNRWILYFKKLFRKKLIAVITNDATTYGGKIEYLKGFVDVFVAPSNKVYDFLEAKKIAVCKIPFFVDPNIFKPLKFSKMEICQKLAINYKFLANRIVIGSFQRDSLGTDLSKPKWQKSPDLLIDILKKLPSNSYMVILAGPRRHYIVKRCRENNIPFLFCGDISAIEKNRDDILTNNLPQENVNYLYNLCDLYIITSKSEGGPKQVLESSLTKTLVFSTKVGIAPDILHPFVLFGADELEAVVKKIKEYFVVPSKFEEYIESNFQSARREMDLNVLKQKYRELVLKS